MKSGKPIDYVIPIICGALLMVIVVVTFIQIVLRNLFNTGLAWYDDISQFAMTWMILFATIWLTKHNQHLNTGLKMQRKLPARQSYLIDGILDLVTIGVAAMVAYQSAIFTLGGAMGVGLTSLPWLKLGYLYIVLPLSMLGVCYYYLKSFLKNMACIFKKN
jgi:C4-dicarboxylate transporter DctQ subunit